jgi:hypothetical protein
MSVPHEKRGLGGQACIVHRIVGGVDKAALGSGRWNHKQKRVIPTIRALGLVSVPLGRQLASMRWGVDETQLPESTESKNLKQKNRILELKGAVDA